MHDFWCSLPVLVVVGSCHDQIHQVLILQRQGVMQCRHKDAAASSRKGIKGARAGADEVGDIRRGRQRAEDAIVDNQWQAIKTRKTRHFGKETQNLRDASGFGDVGGEIVEMAKVAVVVGVLQKLKCF